MSAARLYSTSSGSSRCTRLPVTSLSCGRRMWLWCECVRCSQEKYPHGLQPALSATPCGWLRMRLLSRAARTNTHRAAPACPPQSPAECWRRCTGQMRPCSLHMSETWCCVTLGCPCSQRACNAPASSAQQQRRRCEPGKPEPQAHSPTPSPPSWRPAAAPATATSRPGSSAASAASSIKHSSLKHSTHRPHC